MTFKQRETKLTFHKERGVQRVCHFRMTSTNTCAIGISFLFGCVVSVCLNILHASAEQALKNEAYTLLLCVWREKKGMDSLEILPASQIFSDHGGKLGFLHLNLSNIQWRCDLVSGVMMNFTYATQQKTEWPRNLTWITVWFLNSGLMLPHP